MADERTRRHTGFPAEIMTGSTGNCRWRTRSRARRRCSPRNMQSLSPDAGRDCRPPALSVESRFNRCSRPIVTPSIEAMVIFASRERRANSRTYARGRGFLDGRRRVTAAAKPSGFPAAIRWCARQPPSSSRIAQASRADADCQASPRASTHQGQSVPVLLLDGEAANDGTGPVEALPAARNPA